MAELPAETELPPPQSDKPPTPKPLVAPQEPQEELLGEQSDNGEQTESGTSTSTSPLVEVSAVEISPSAPERWIEDDRDPLQSYGIKIDGQTEMEADMPSVNLNDRFNIHPARPLPDLASPSAYAFEADSLLPPEKNVFALVCIPDLLVRTGIVEKIVEQKIPGCLDLIDYGVIDWPLMGKKTIILIFQRPMGGRVVDVLKKETSSYKKNDLMKVILDGMIEGIAQLHSLGINHRAIRHDNLFFLDERREEVLLGEFVSSPPGFDQPSAYETIERGMADVGGRGMGHAEDDMYACGVALAFLIQDNIPTKGYSQEALIITKITETSYQALVGGKLLTVSLLDVLRGLLNDNPAQRWGMEELEIWKEGRRVPPTHSSSPTKAVRALKVDGFGHFYPRTLACALAKRPESALKLIKDGTVEQWLSRGLKDLELAASIADLTKWAIDNREKPETDDVLLASTLMHLDPLGPIRFKGCSFMPDSFGTAIVIERLRGGDLTAFSDAVLQEIPNLWFDINADKAHSMDMEIIDYNRMRIHLSKKGPGYGIERCMYELNEGFPCRSPLFDNEYVMYMEDILPTLDEIERAVDSKTIPIDRHIAAFVGAKAKNAVAKFLYEIADSDEAAKTLGSLKLLAFLQDVYTPRPLPGLAKWIGSQIGPVIKVYQNRRTRKAMEADIPKRVRTGMLSELLKTLDDSEARMKDEEGYAEVIKNFQANQDDIEQIKLSIGPESETFDQVANQIAAITSLVIMTFATIVMLITS